MSEIAQIILACACGASSLIVAVGVVVNGLRSKGQRT
jgi:hypothetical protein